MNVPAEAARLPAGATKTTTGTSETRIRLMMSRIEASSPPGVSSRITSASRLSRSAFPMACTMTCAEMGWIAPSTVSTSMTGLSAAGAMVVPYFAPRRSTAAQARSATRTNGERVTSAPVPVRLHRLGPADLVPLVHEDDGRNVTQELLALHHRVGEDDHGVPNVREARGGPVQADHARGPGAPDGVGVE